MNAFPDNLADLRGYLKVYDVVAPGKRGKILHEDPNIIVAGGRVRVAELIANVSGDFVDKVGVGDGGAPQSDLLIPIVPVLSDTALVHELLQNAITSAVVVDQTLTLTATFLTASLTPLDFIDSANQVINEAGLFCGDGILFARKTFPSIPFSPGDRVGVLAEWSIEVL